MTSCEKFDLHVKKECHLFNLHIRLLNLCFRYSPGLGVVVSTVTVAVVTGLFERLVGITVDFVGETNTDVDFMTGDVVITGIVGLSDNVSDDVTLGDIVTDDVGDIDTEVNEGVTDTLGDNEDDELGCNVANVRDTVVGIEDVGDGLIDGLYVVVDVVDDIVVVSL